ncbi:MAG: TlpA family protein disulfide reductase [Bacteroidales bacterium]|nr:TlpA family protein disulfide reductase [Bacteroidales bacterium]
MKTILSIVIFLSLFFVTEANTCKIFGNAGTYAGETIKLYTYSDYITLTKKVIAESLVDNEGYFTFIVECNKSFEAFIDLDVFVGYIIVEPGKEFKIVLPKKTIRRHEDIMNPFFKPFEFYIRIMNDDNTVTQAMKKFDALYENASKIIFKTPNHINPGLTKKEIQKIKDSTSYCNNQFFKNYKKYRLLKLRCDAVYKNKKAVIRKNFSNSDILFDNPAYNKLLKEDFGNILFETQGDTIFKLLAADVGWNMISRMLANTDLCQNQDFREYFLFINLYNEFYKNTIFKNKIIDVLYSAKKYIKNPHTLNAVNNFLENSSNLITGNKSLDFRLSDLNTYMHSLSDYRGKFVYLGFFSTESYTCKKDILLLKSLAEKKMKMLKIIIVFKENNIQTIKTFLKDVKTDDIIFLHGDDSNKIIEEYDVRAFPTYYLISPAGRLSVISAPGPSEDFESLYFKAKQDWKIKKIREKN